MQLVRGDGVTKRIFSWTLLRFGWRRPGRSARSPRRAPSTILLAIAAAILLGGANIWAQFRGEDQTLKKIFDSTNTALRINTVIGGTYTIDVKGSGAKGDGVDAEDGAPPDPTTDGICEGGHLCRCEYLEIRP